jgi:NodT family efflux transporter outer membrane factor (OMF) lipoprotein
MNPLSFKYFQKSFKIILFALILFFAINQGKGQDSLKTVQLPWREFFQDEQLTRLIDTALIRNADLQLAYQEMEIARNYYRISRGQQMPSASLEISDLHSRKNDSGEYSANFLSTWEIDMWGKLRNYKKAARQRFLASKSGKQLLQTMIIAEVAKGYFELVNFDAELEIIEKNIKLQSSALDIVKVQQQAGRATNLAVQQFEAQLLSTMAQKNEIKRSIISGETYLNMLLNRNFQPIPRIKEILQRGLSSEFNHSVSSDILQNRPDVRKAAYLLSAAGFEQKAAHAALFPSLVISPGLNYSSKEPSLFINPANLGWNILSSLTAPLFQGKLLRANFQIRQAEKRQALFTYQQTVIRSSLEIQELLEKIKITEEEQKLKSKEVTILNQAIVTASDLYAYGFANYLEVINAQKNLRDSELALTTIQKNKNLLLIDLFRSLGGGVDG